MKGKETLRANVILVYVDGMDSMRRGVPSDQNFLEVILGKQR
jgi:hypothetical protein